MFARIAMPKPRNTDRGLLSETQDGKRAKPCSTNVVPPMEGKDHQIQRRLDNSLLSALVRQRAAR
jgi:hypothetical protein